MHALSLEKNMVKLFSLAQGCVAFLLQVFVLCESQGHNMISEKSRHKAQMPKSSPIIISFHFIQGKCQISLSCVTLQWQLFAGDTISNSIDIWNIFIYLLKTGIYHNSRNTRNTHVGQAMSSGCLQSKSKSFYRFSINLGKKRHF